MRIRKSLNSGFAKPYDGFQEIFFYAITVEVAKPKAILCIRKSLISGFAIPYDGFQEIFFHSIEVGNPKVILSLCISLPGGF